MCAVFAPGQNATLIALLLFLGGLFRSMQFTALVTLQVADVAQPDMNHANTLATLTAQLTMGQGPALGALSLNGSMVLRGAAVPGLADFRAAFLISGVIALLGVAGCLRLPAEAGLVVSGHKSRLRF